MKVGVFVANFSDKTCSIKLATVCKKKMKPAVAQFIAYRSDKLLVLAWTVYWDLKKIRGKR
jgi:hypothetical protein